MHSKYKSRNSIINLSYFNESFRLTLLYSLFAISKLAFSQDFKEVEIRNSVIVPDSICECYQFLEKKTKYLTPLDFLTPYNAFIKQTRLGVRRK